ncbi:MAG: hypothetical protein ACK5YI_05680 [Rhodospirillales bacterium]|jgi:hypothetical protein
MDRLPNGYEIHSALSAVMVQSCSNDGKGQSIFHSYVRASSGQLIDLNRAQFVMDSVLVHEAIAWVEANETSLASTAGVARLSEDARNAAFFARYCELHRARYGAPFEPDVNPAWQ